MNLKKQPSKLAIKSAYLTLVALLGVQIAPAFSGVDVVYGEDNRVDVYESNNSAHVELSKSTAAMVHFENLDFIGGVGEYKLTGSQLGSRMGLCIEEPFRHQRSAAVCSGFLVGDDLLVTAGHCVTNESKCLNYRWVFNYKVDSAEQVDVVVTNDDVYSCKRVIKSVLERGTGNDYALIQLDRKVTQARPLKFRTKGFPKVGEKIVVIGHPSGLPTKIADGASVRSLKKTHFVANLDTYGGNSGSAVFNERTGEVEGILVRGERDYAVDEDAACRRSNYVGNDAGRGEDVTYITKVEPLMNMLK